MTHYSVHAAGMPILEFEEDYDVPLGVLVDMILDGDKFVVFQHTVMKHLEAVAGKVEGEYGQQARTMTYTIPEHGVLKVLKQGDTYVTQRDEIIKTNDRLVYNTVSTSEGGELAKSVMIKAYWVVTPAANDNSHVSLKVDYTFNASMLVRSLVEKGLKGEITNRHRKLLDFYSLCVEEKKNTDRKKKRATFVFDEENGSFQFLTPLQQSMAAPPGDLPIISLDSTESLPNNSMRSLKFNHSIRSVMSVDVSGSRASWGGQTFITVVDDASQPTSPTDSPLASPKKNTNVLRPPIKPLSERTPILKKDKKAAKPKKKGWVFQCCCVYVDE